MMFKKSSKMNYLQVEGAVELALFWIYSLLNTLTFEFMSDSEGLGGARSG